MAEQTGVQSVERTFALIELLSRHHEMNITALAVESGLHKTTVFRLLHTLCDLGYVRRNEKTGQYGLTLKLLRISSELLAGYDLRAIARPILKRLSQECGETVHLVVREGCNVVYIDKFEAPQSAVRMVSRIGLSLPMPCTAVGKALLAQGSDHEAEQVWRGCEITPKTPYTIVDFEKFREELATVRSRGYAVDNEENECGVRCVAAALPDPDGGWRYAFSVSAPLSRMDDATLQRTAERVLAARREILEG